ncbi:hypothetical protein GIB67_042915 [Kingdonia uniflora]|uniref:RNase H type-1 domain-containing protein n=1 Tax=Kingdonia uniflora TaxID=39325 RepID=A0A7J7MLI2_9MAGN|nr:hypothetical protein GIB67_010836 [Kingdonia uniflora]KAF6173747.1 hypothetical protein GIB67_042915 [Kingdonia uniflora]
MKTDGCSKGNPGPSGIGAIFRNYTGDVMGTLSKSMGSGTSFAAEAIVYAVQEAIDMGWPRLWTESDSEATITAFTKKETLVPKISKGSRHLQAGKDYILHHLEECKLLSRFSLKGEGSFLMGMKFGAC